MARRKVGEDRAEYLSLTCKLPEEKKLVQKFKEHCYSSGITPRKGVLEMLEAFMDEGVPETEPSFACVTSDDPATESEASGDKVPHGLYILDYHDGTFKLGLSETSVLVRAAQQCNSGVSLVAASAFSVDPKGHRKLEALCHRMMQSHRISNEERFLDNSTMVNLRALFSQNQKASQDGMLFDVPKSTSSTVNKLIAIARKSELPYSDQQKMLKILFKKRG